MARRRLTEQQKARIANIQNRRRQRASVAAESALLQGTGGSEAAHGRVVVRHGRSVVVRDDHGSDVHCLFRQNLGEVVCGDRVLWQPTDNGGGVVLAVEPRQTVLSRPDYSGHEKPIAANITQLIVVLAPQPEPTGYLLDQYLIAAEHINVAASLCLNKMDLLTDAERNAFRSRFAHYETLGYPLLQISAKTEHGLEPLFERCRRQTSILVGQSGVGKSSLINALLPQQTVIEGALSEATGLGRHTTSAATLYQLTTGGEIIDSPGVRSFRLGTLERREVEHGFPEISRFIGQCRFHNCAHRDEPGCAVREAVEKGEIHPERLQSFLHLSASP